MQGNDLEVYTVARNVVTLIPTLILPPPSKRKRWYHLSDHVDPVSMYSTNNQMVSWMLNHAYLRSEPFEVWGFAYDQHWEELTDRIENLAGRATMGYELFDTEDAAVFALTNDMSIRTVYDADMVRNRRLWGMRGYSVRYGDRP